MARKLGIAIVIILISLSTGGGCNVFTDMSVRNSDDAIIDDINNLIDKGLWNDAVLKFSLISPAGMLRRDVLDLEAAAYAGRGGLNTIGLITSLNNNASSGANTLFQELMAAFPATTRFNLNDEITSQSIIFGLSSQLSTLAGLSVDENVFLIFVEFAKLGTLFSTDADTNQDGILDPTFDNCNLAMLSATDATEVIIAISAISLAITNTGTSIAGSSFNATSAICSFLPTGCSILSQNDPTLVANPLIIRAARTLVGETNSGVGLKVVANASTFEFAPPMNLPPPNNLCP